MTKRFAALLIALVVAAAPTAAEACLIACVSGPAVHHSEASAPHAMHYGSRRAQPACHETGTPARRLSPGPPACGHTGAVISASVVTTIRPGEEMAAPIQIVASAVAAVDYGPFAAHSRVVPSAGPLELRLAAPLRI